MLLRISVSLSHRLEYEDRDFLRFVLALSRINKLCLRFLEQQHLRALHLLTRKALFWDTYMYFSRRRRGCYRGTVCMADS